jgi:TPP-dependent pyruvate/acetoin dehydrogenase alpha subunit
MTDKKPDKKEITSDVLLADVMLRITAMEKLLIDKKIFTQEELAKTTEEIAQRVAKVVLEKAKSSKDVEDFIAKLEADSKKSSN